MFIIICVAFRILLTILALVICVSCGSSPTPAPANSAWQAGDVRALEAPNQLDPAYDMIAAYARETKTDIELRFDLLGSPGAGGYDLVLFLDTGPGGTKHTPWQQDISLEWDVTIRYPARGMPQARLVSGAAAAIRPRILQLDVQDAAVLRLSKKELSAIMRGGQQDTRNFRFEVFLFRAGENQPVDAIGPLETNGPQVAQSAQLLLAFWDTLPSATPAQALRRWDGAHTGPFGQRHGLSILLEASSRTGVPVTLLDLKVPERLAAVDAMGGLTRIREMVREGLLLVPDVIYGDPLAAEESLYFSQQAGQRFQLPKSPFLYGTIQSAFSSADHPAVFARTRSDHIQQWGTMRLIPVPAREVHTEDQPGEQGLSLNTRIALLNAALSGDAARLVVQGGSLPSSAWGDSLVASPSMEYIAGHPWIHALGGDDLQTIVAVPGEPDCADLLCDSQPAETALPSQVRRELEESPKNLFSELAWRMYLSLTSPDAEPALLALRQNYLSQIGPLLAAARWNESPSPRSECREDLDWDQLPECILASDSLFLVIDPGGGRLALAAARQRGKPLLLVGSRSLRITGLGDPLDWNQLPGLYADPQEIPGVFADAPGRWQEYEPAEGGGVITITGAQNGVQKQFSLIPNGFRVAVQSGTSSQNTIPLLLIDAALESPGGYESYQAEESPNPYQVTWALDKTIRFRLLSQGAELASHSFLESLPYLRQPEDPNREMTPGFLIPFPMAVVDLHPAQNFSVDFIVEPAQ